MDGKPRHLLGSAGALGGDLVECALDIGFRPDIGVYRRPEPARTLDLGAHSRSGVFVAAKAVAHAAPMPEPPPATTATRPAREVDIERSPRVEVASVAEPREGGPSAA